MNLSHPNLTAEDHHAALYGEDHERPAPYCAGPGHLLGCDEQGFLIRLEDCPTCANQPLRNHRTFRGFEDE